MLQQLKREFQPQQLLSSFVSGSVLGIIIITVMISFATMIFSGEVSDYLPTGIGITLVSAIILSIVTTLASSYANSISVPQDSPAAIVAVITSGLALHSISSTEVKFLTIVAILALASLLTGVLFLLIGMFKLGNFVRYLPYPVVGGFLAGTGLLLTLGAFGVLTGETITLSLLPDLFQLPLLVRWLPGLIFASLLLFLLRRYNHFLLMPGLLVGTIVLFYASLLITGTSISEASDLGWFIGPFPEGSLWRPLTIQAFTRADWSFVLSQSGNIVIIMFVSTVALLLNASGVEVAVKQDIDLNRELRVAGIANLLTGFGGGLTGYPTMSLTALGHNMKGGRLSGFIIAGICGVVLLLGTSVLAYFPRLIAGGLLMFLGLSFLIEWGYDAWFKMPKVDYGVVLLILGVVGVVGYLEGVAVGIVAAIILFVFNFSRINVIKHELSGTGSQSNVIRSPVYRQLLSNQGYQIYILKLQSFIFFGTANKLLKQVHLRINEQNPPRVVVLDFHLVTGLDTSAAYSFAKMKHEAEIQGIVLAFTHLSPEIHHQLEREVFSDGQNTVWRIFPDLDHVMEWWEDQQIQSFEELGLTAKSKTIFELFEETLPDSIPIETLTKYLKPLNIDQGHVLIQQGGPSEFIYFIESGQVTVQLHNPDGATIRLSRLYGGTVIGEVGTYLGVTATATVIADIPCSIYSLSTRDLHRMEEQNPELAAAFHRFIVQLLAERLARQTKILEALMQ